MIKSYVDSVELENERWRMMLLRQKICADYDWLLETKQYIF